MIVSENLRIDSADVPAGPIEQIYLEDKLNDAQTPHSVIISYNLSKTERNRSRLDKEFSPLKTVTMSFQKPKLSLMPAERVLTENDFIKSLCNYRSSKISKQSSQEHKNLKPRYRDKTQMDSMRINEQIREKRRSHFNFGPQTRLNGPSELSGDVTSNQVD